MTRLLCLWLMLCLPVGAFATQVHASLDRNPVALGETVTLNLQIEGSGMVAAPDLSALAPDFEVLGSSSSSSLSLVNGQRSAQVVLGIALRPRHAGELTIPSLQVAGSQTAPLTLTVTPPDPAAAQATGQAAFLEASAQPTHVRVGQQLVFTVRLYLAGSLSSGSLEDPQLTGADVRRLGDDLDYDVVRGGRSYHVIERRYAVIPQRAGELELPALQFQGELIDPADPDSFFSMGSPTSASSPALTVEVAPVPTDWGSSAWLPARALSLKLDGVPADHTLHVGQPLDLSMTLEATGLPYEALPALSLPQLDGATVYPDKPVNVTRNDGQWLLGRRQQHFALVPSRPGPLTIAPVTLKWWNVQTGQPEEARIPAQHFTVLPGTAGNTAAPPRAASAAQTPATAPAPRSALRAPPPARSAPVPARRAVWTGVALLLVLGGVLAGWLHWRARAGQRRRSGPSVRALRQRFFAAAQGSDPTAQAHALLDWARAERPALTSLGAVAEALASERQRTAIAQLQRRRFGTGADARGSSDLAAAFRGGFQWRDATPGEPAPLPPLYPFKLR